MKNYRIITIPGDGIGPELMESTTAVLEAVQHADETLTLNLEEHEAGAARYAKYGKRISDETIQACREADGVLKAPVGNPAVRTPEGTEAGLLGGVLRTGLDLFANMRPVKLYPGIRSPLAGYAPGGIDYVVIRENTEGLYASRDKGVGGPNAVADTMIITRPGVERVVRFAFELSRKRGGAPEDGVRRVTCVDKSNVLRSMALFREVFFEVAADYPDIEAEAVYSDACANHLIIRPAHYDVLVMENMLGDLLSDLGGATAGGLGMCPSGNIGEKFAFFEAVHGSAPDIAGKGIANPLSLVLSAALMLAHIGESEAANQIETSVWEALEAGEIRIDDKGRAVDGSQAITDAVCAHVRG